MTCKRSQNLVRMAEGVLITPKKASDCKDVNIAEVVEELADIAFQIRLDPIPEEEIQQRLQSIHEFIMRLADENKDLKKRITVLEEELKGTVAVLQGENIELKGTVAVLQGENKELKITVAVLQGENKELKITVERLKQELESLQTDILTGEVVKGVETKIIDLLGGDGNYVSLKHVVKNINNPAELIEEGVFRSEDDVKEADKRWKKLKEQYKLKLKDVTLMKSLREQRNQRAHPEIGTTVTAMKKVIQSTRDEKIQEVMKKLLAIVQDYRI